jgi:transposase
MSEEQVAGSVVQRRSRAEADRLVAEYEASGMSRREFCARQGVALGTLDLYRKRQRREAMAARAPGGSRGSGAKLVAVEVAGKEKKEWERGCGLAVVLGKGRRIEVRASFDEATLKRLVDLLEKA